jgi:pimeloyl-ACP methyl ester carboxylesterase
VFPCIYKDNNLGNYYRSEDGRIALMGWYDRALAQLGVPYERLYVPTRFGMTHIIASGNPSAPPVLLLHGINTNAAVWRPQIESLSRYYRVYAPDIVGFAGMSAPTRLSYHNDSYARWAVDVLDGLETEQANVIGSSAGGHFALKLAVYAPERVRKLVLMNPCGLVRFRFPYTLTRIPGFPALVNILSPYMASQELAQKLVRKGVAPHLPLDTERVEFSHLILKHYRRYGPPGVLRNWELRRMIAPTLLLFSQYEVFTDPATAIRYARRTLPNLIAAEIIPDAGHDMNKDQPALVDSRLLSFLGQLQTVDQIQGLTT